MAQAERVILLFLSIILIINNVEAKNQLEIITKYYEKLHRTPIIVLLDRVSESKNLLRTSNDPNEAIDAKDDKIFDVGKDRKQVIIHYLNAILRSTGNDSDPTVKETKEKFEKALRSRCEKYLECEVKCKPKKKDKCEDMCQQIYDKLKMCDKKQKFPVKTNKEVYEYLKKNPPTRATPKPKDSCESSNDCEESSNSCNESSEEC